MESTHYKLTYFDAKGSGEILRYMFAYAGVDYEDVRIPIGTLTPERKKEIGISLGCLPSLEVNGHVYTQYITISRYIATKFGLAGDTELEALRIDETVYMIDDYFKKWLAVFSCESEELREELRQQILKSDNITMMTYYDNLLEQNLNQGNLWFVGSHLSWADIVFASTTSHFRDCLMKVDILEDFPKLQQLRARVLDQKGIKEHIAKRPNTLF